MSCARGSAGATVRHRSHRRKCNCCSTPRNRHRIYPAGLATVAAQCAVGTLTSTACLRRGQSPSTPAPMAVSPRHSCVPARGLQTDCQRCGRNCERGRAMQRRIDCPRLLLKKPLVISGPCRRRHVLLHPENTPGTHFRRGKWRTSPTIVARRRSARRRTRSASGAASSKPASLMVKRAALKTIA